MTVSKNHTLRNSVMVAPQSLNLLVGVRVPIPQPKNQSTPFGVDWFFFYT